MSERMGAVLYGLLIAHHSDKAKADEEILALREQYRVVVNAPDNPDSSWLEIALRVVEYRERRSGRRTIRSISEKIDLAAQLKV